MVRNYIDRFQLRRRAGFLFCIWFLFVSNSSSATASEGDDKTASPKVARVASEKKCRCALGDLSGCAVDSGKTAIHRLKTVLGVKKIALQDLLPIKPKYVALNKDLGGDPNIIRPSWNPSHFTDPTKHNNAKFRYIVTSPSSHSDTPESYQSQAEQAVIRRKMMPNLELDPRKLSERHTISASVISNEYPYTFADSGVILRVPEENIYFTSITDVGQNNILTQTDAEVARYVQSVYLNEYGLMNPDNLIANSIANLSQQRSLGHYNEIGITGESAFGSVEVIGVYVNKKDYFPFGPTRKLLEWAQRNDVPIVWLDGK